MQQLSNKSLTFEEHTCFRKWEGVWDTIAGSVQLGHDSLQAAMLLYELHGSHTTNACITCRMASFGCFAFGDKYALLMLMIGAERCCSWLACLV